MKNAMYNAISLIEFKVKKLRENLNLDNVSDKIKFLNEISKILLNIAIEEMHHINILGEILVKLGAKPFFVNANQKEWSASNVKYQINDLSDAMKINISSEESAIAGYRRLMQYTNNVYLRKVYERIILDEKTHLEIFKKILENC